MQAFAYSNPTALAEAWRSLGCRPCLLEALVPIHRELSVLVARAADGAMVHLPVQQNLHRDGILAVTQVPAPEDDLGDGVPVVQVEQAAEQIFDGQEARPAQIDVVDDTFAATAGLRVGDVMNAAAVPGAARPIGPFTDPRPPGRDDQRLLAIAGAGGEHHRPGAETLAPAPAQRHPLRRRPRRPARGDVEIALGAEGTGGFSYHLIRVSTLGLRQPYERAGINLDKVDQVPAAGMVPALALAEAFKIRVTEINHGGRIGRLDGVAW